MNFGWVGKIFGYALKASTDSNYTRGQLKECNIKLETSDIIFITLSSIICFKALQS